MIVLESNNPEESKIGWFVYVPKNRVNSENWKHDCEHLNNLEILQENTLYLPLIGISQTSVSNGSKLRPKTHSTHRFVKFQSQEDTVHFSVKYSDY